jgi:glycosyltransferase involved in cell wall biosynthesis
VELLQLKKILIVVNSWHKVLTGGDYHILKVAQRWSRDTSITYLLPRLAYSSAKKLLTGETIVVDSFLERETSNILQVILLYCVRMGKVLVSPPPKDEYDVIIASNHWLIDVLPAVYLQSKNPSCKLVAYWHGLAVKKSRLWWYVPRKINDMLSLMLLRRYFDLVFVSNQLVKDFLVAHRVDAQKIQFANYGTDPVPVDLDFREPLFDACYVGRLVKNKGIFDLVAIWKEVSSQIPDARLAIVGDGSGRGQLIHSIDAAHLKKRVQLCGFVEESEKFRIMRRSKLFLMPSYADDWGIAILEALSCGLPAITYDFPALRCIWDHDVTYVPAGDRKLFADAVLRFLHDPQLRSEFSRKGLKRSTRHVWASVAEHERDAIENL